MTMIWNGCSCIRSLKPQGDDYVGSSTLKKKQRSLERLRQREAEAEKRRIASGKTPKSVLRQKNGKQKASKVGTITVC